MKYIAAIALVFIGLVELVLRVVALVLLICTLFGMIFLDNVCFPDYIVPFCFKLAEQCLDS